MITKSIKEKIESRFGKKIRYPKDCYALANDITKVCMEQISPATLMRLFGLTKTIVNQDFYTGRNCTILWIYYLGRFLECSCIEVYNTQNNDSQK